MYYAVLVGINKYDHLGDLIYARDDAESFKKALVGNKNAIFLEDNVFLLMENYSDSGKPSLSNILEKLEEICVSAREGDLILFYFAGHGFDSNGQSYLAVKDTADKHALLREKTALSVNAN